MANVPESASYDAGIYQLETTDQVLGGSAGIANAQAKGLANRTAYLKGVTDALVATAHGQCRLTFVSTTSLKLAPFNGRNLFINGALQQVPAAGVTVANTSLSASTLYYVYAYMNGSTMTLELSTTGHSQDATTGVEVKTGNATRTLVGMCVTNASSQFQDGGAVVGVLSYFNRARKVASAYFTAARSTTSTSAAELNTEIRVTFACWAGEVPSLRCNGGAWTTTAGPGYAYIGIDSLSQTDSGGGVNQSSQVPFSAEYSQAVSEAAAHFGTIYAIAASGGTTTLSGHATQAAGQRTSLSVSVMG